MIDRQRTSCWCLLMDLLIAQFSVDLCLVLRRQRKNNNARWQIERQTRWTDISSQFVAMESDDIEPECAVVTSSSVRPSLFNGEEKKKRTECADIQRWLTFDQRADGDKHRQQKKIRLIFRFRGKRFSLWRDERGRERERDAHGC